MDILGIYWIYRGYIGYIEGYYEKKMSIGLKLIKIHENVRIVKM